MKRSYEPVGNELCRGKFGLDPSSRDHIDSLYENLSNFSDKLNFVSFKGFLVATVLAGSPKWRDIGISYFGRTRNTIDIVFSLQRYEKEFEECLSGRKNASMGVIQEGIYK